MFCSIVNSILYCLVYLFRVSSHNLRVETDRHENPKLPLEERKCDKCNSDEIEDELHSLLICSKNSIPRVKLLKVCDQFHNFRSLNNTNKFQVIMSSKEPDIIFALGKFLDEVM